MKHFLKKNIYAFTLGRRVVNEKLIFTVKKIYMLCFFFSSSFSSFFVSNLESVVVTRVVTRAKSNLEAYSQNTFMRLV